MGITHEWNGTVLTITSDSGSSSADLKGEKGDTGVRGAQGEKGNTGEFDTSMLNNYATEDYVGQQIALAQMPEKEADLSYMYRKDEINDLLNGKRFKLIEEYTVADGDNINRFERTKMNLRDFLLVVEAPVNAINLGMDGAMICAKSKGSSNTLYIMSMHTTTGFTSSKRFHIYCSELGNGSRMNTFKTTQTVNSNSSSANRTYYTLADFALQKDRAKVLDRFYIYVTTKDTEGNTYNFPVGTKFSIYGVSYDDED